MDGGLLMVIPSTVRLIEGKYQVDGDYANNLQAYLRYFSSVTFACPVSDGNNVNITRSIQFTEIPGHERLVFVPLPYAYREDRFLRFYWRVRNKLAELIRSSDFLLFSPHANFEWSILAAKLSISMRRKFGIESDHDKSVTNFHLKTMRPGINKLRKIWWANHFFKDVDQCLAKSALALLQGQDVYDGLCKLAPNPKKVLNVQVDLSDYISDDELSEKIDTVKGTRPLAISYAGRMAEMKGPLDWLDALKAAIEKGANLRATWLGEGPLFAEMTSRVERLGLAEFVALPGLVPRNELMQRLRRTDIFLFCHKTGESPRCLGEALASGAALVGYGSSYPRDLVAELGGGEFAATGDWAGLASLIVGLDKDRSRLVRLVCDAARSGARLDRETAIRQRIDLIRTYLGR